MPKKGKAGGKKGGKKDDGGATSSNPFAQVVAKPEEVLELVATREKLEKSLQAQQELQEIHRQLKEQLAQQQFEQSEIFAYLNKELVQKSRAVAVLEARVQELELQVQSHQTDFDIKLMEEKAMAREMTAKLAREVGKYEKELGDLNVFIAKKNELESELDETKTELLRERKKHDQIISELERKTVQEKERLRKEMEGKIREAKEAFMRLTDNQLEATTKKTMQENEQMASELAFQNHETERLLQKNSKLADENRNAKRELTLHKQTEAEMARRNHAYLKTIKTLLSKLKSLDVQKRELEKQGKSKEESIVLQYRQRVTLLQETVEDGYRQLEEMREELEGKTNEVARMEGLKDEVSLFILKAADETKQQLAEHEPGGSWIEESALPELSSDQVWRPGDPIPPRLEDLNMVQRERVLRYLLGKLHDLQIGGVAAGLRMGYGVAAAASEGGGGAGGGGGGNGGGGNGGVSLPPINLNSPGGNKLGAPRAQSNNLSPGRTPLQARTEAGSRNM